MATARSDLPPIAGRVDAAGRLIAADPPLKALQGEAGSAIGKAVAIPQIAALASLASRLGTPLLRPVVTATSTHDLDLLVRATPDDDGVDLLIERWTERPPSGSRLESLLGASPTGADAAWSVDERLQLVHVSAEFAEQLGAAPEDLVGQPLTKVLKLEDDEEGDMPLLTALAAQRPFEHQHARLRSSKDRHLILAGEVAVGADGRFAGLTGTAVVEGEPAKPQGSVDFNRIVDEALRSPLDRIIGQAEQIVGKADGPIQPDYAAYGADIATAARHLLSVLTSIVSHEEGPGNRIDLAELAEEAVLMLDSAARDRGIAVQLQARRRLPVIGDRRAVIQILVNLIGNAIRHSPEHAHIDLYFSRSNGLVRVAVEDQGSGIPAGDEQRIFERFERAHAEASGTGLGLAIARRLARSMGGDVTLEGKPTPGARFCLTLPEAVA